MKTKPLTKHTHYTPSRVFSNTFAHRLKARRFLSGGEKMSAWSMTPMFEQISYDMCETIIVLRCAAVSITIASRFCHHIIANTLILCTVNSIECTWLEHILPFSTCVIWRAHTIDKHSIKRSTVYIYRPHTHYTHVCIMHKRYYDLPPAKTLSYSLPLCSGCFFEKCDACCSYLLIVLENSMLLQLMLLKFDCLTFDAVETFYLSAVDLFSKAVMCLSDLRNAP